jgi:glycosyltransferase involved in cell wall biosynthesis
MKIGIDVTMLQIQGGRHGIGSYLRGLIPALARQGLEHEYALFAYAAPALDLPPLPERFRVTTLNAPPLGRARALVSHQLALPALARRLGLGVLHVPGVSYNASMPAIPLWPAVPIVVTVHDLIPLLFPDEVLPRRRHRLFYLLMLRACARADHLVCVSEATRQDVRSRLGLPDSRLSVVPNAADALFTTAPGPAGDRRAAALPADGFVLHVGGAAPLKNLASVLAAMVDLWRERVSAHLVCVAAAPFDPVALCPGIAAHRNRVHVLERVSPRFLRWLYQHALCLAFPSLYEGFGLPVLEAMASGCPVITARTGSLPEVGGEAAVYVEPLSPRSIGLAIRDFARSPGRRAAARAAGLEQAGRWSYDRTAAATLAVYEAVGRRS